ncbi:MAG: LicD family protein [Clostridiales bacterium]|nr:LicD family protein [Clostridiales bacterium]
MQSLTELSVNEVKARLLDILVYFKQVCDENDIQYSLAYGTLLGAVRHGGFIPWDDDVDVCMLRDDYERLIKILCDSKHDRFKLIYAGNEPTYYYNFAKIVDCETTVTEIGSKPITGYGVFIDIFPLDNCPSDRKKFNKLIKQIRRVSHFRSASVCNGSSPVMSSVKNAVRRAVAPFAKMFGFRHWLNKEEKKIRKYNDTNTGYVACLEECLSYSEIMRKYEITFDGRIMFENMRFSCFSNYDKYLQGRYGNYMELPPESERVQRHGYKAYLKEVQ